MVIAFLRVCLVLADGALVWWVVIPWTRQVLSLLRFGRMHLCLPGIPLTRLRQRGVAGGAQQPRVTATRARHAPAGA